MPSKVNASKKRPLTYPHEYAPVLNGPAEEKPVIVAGQAVNLWALVYLPEEDGSQFGSVDMDILATPHIMRWMSEIPEWNYAPKYKPRQTHAPALSPAHRRKGRTLRHL